MSIHSKRGKAFQSIALAIIFFHTVISLHGQLVPVDKVKNDFRSLLNRPVVPLQASIQPLSTDSVLYEKGYFFSEATEKVPFVIYKPVNAGKKKLPVVICLHGTGGSKEGMREVLNLFSKAGFMAVSIDGRYHGERVTLTQGRNKYLEAIIAAWQNKDSTRQEHPFYFDTVFDTWRLIDYLFTRSDVDTNRIGMMGISKGGIETWLAASVDTRIKVVVPVIAAQSFNWSIDNDRWQGRARTIWAAHVQAAKDLGDTGVNRNNVQTFWNKLVPGITGEFDCPSMIRLFAPRPLLILNTENDPNCPLPGAKIAFEQARIQYRSQNAEEKLRMDIEPNEPHRYTPRHMSITVDWFKQWL